MVNHGFYNFLNWFDDRAWYPLGRIVGGTVSQLYVYINVPRHDKTNKVTVCLAKSQISLGILPVWSESSLSAWRNLGSLATHWAHSEDSDQTGQIDAQADLSLRCAHTHFVGFVMSWLIWTIGSAQYKSLKLMFEQFLQVTGDRSYTIMFQSSINEKVHFEIRSHHQCFSLSQIVRSHSLQNLFKFPVKVRHNEKVCPTHNLDYYAGSMSKVMVTLKVIGQLNWMGLFGVIWCTL